MQGGGGRKKKGNQPKAERYSSAWQPCISIPPPPPRHKGRQERTFPPGSAWLRRALLEARAVNVNDSRTASNFSPLLCVWVCPQWSPRMAEFTAKRWLAHVPPVSSQPAASAREGCAEPTARGAIGERWARIWGSQEAPSPSGCPEAWLLGSLLLPRQFVAGWAAVEENAFPPRTPKLLCSHQPARCLHMRFEMVIFETWGLQISFKHWDNHSHVPDCLEELDYLNVVPQQSL